MKKLDINFVFAQGTLNEKEAEFLKVHGMRGAFEALLNQALNGLYPQGVPNTKGRPLRTLQRKLDSIPPEQTELLLEEAEFHLVKEAFTGDEARFNPQQQRGVSIVIEAIENAKNVNPPEVPTK